MNNNLKDKEYLERLRHSASHVLAMAILKLYPNTKLAIGPAIENGFYYDFEFDTKIKEEDFALIEKEMQRIIEANLPIKQFFMKKEEAIYYYKNLNQPYKLELLESITDKKVSFYVIGDKDSGFVDLCKGPHVNSTGEIKAFKLLSIAGAYWRGDENNKMLTRIYGIAFDSQEALNEYLKNQEEAKKRDHRVLGKRMKLFMQDNDVGPGLTLWMPRGAYLRYQIMKFAFEEYLKDGYMPVATPHIATTNLWSISGHLDFYRDSMYPEFKVKNETSYIVKPMNCPLHIKIYKSEIRSYRDLPIRYTEMGTVYRYEKPGELHGLLRVRGFTQDDAHIICTPEQLSDELEKVLKLTFHILTSLGLKQFELTISSHDPDNTRKYIGDPDAWIKAEDTLKKVVKDAGYDFIEYKGEAAFYGPKIDFHFIDSLGRRWQLSTIQLDFNLPLRFKMEYVGKDGKKHTPFMIHRALLGSLDRAIAILIENYAGNLPLWLQWEPVRIIPINDSCLDYAKKIQADLDKANIRSTIDDKNEPMNGKIRQAEEDMIPYIVVVGPKEVETGTVSVRLLGKGNIGVIKVEEFIPKLREEISSRAVESPFIK